LAGSRQSYSKNKKGALFVTVYLINAYDDDDVVDLGLLMPL